MMNNLSLSQTITVQSMLYNNMGLIDMLSNCAVRNIKWI